MKSLVILTGGKSSRMGRDKTMLPCQGMTFVERIFTNALVCFEHIIISTDTAEHGKKIMNLPKIADVAEKNPGAVSIVADRYEAIGPMGGLMSVFEETPTEKIAVIPVDVPLADMEVLSKLWDMCKEKPVFSVLDGERTEPLIGAYPRSAYPKLKETSDKGIYKLKAAFGKDDAEVFGISGEKYKKAFKNYNTQEDLDL